MFYKFHPRQTPSGLIPPVTPGTVLDQNDAPVVKPEVRPEPKPVLSSEPVPSREDILQEAITYLSNADLFDNKHLPFILVLRHNISREEAAEIVCEALQVLIAEGKLEDPEKLAAEQATKQADELEEGDLGDIDVDAKDATKSKSVLTRLISAIRGHR
jgi:hypothetical protein